MSLKKSLEEKKFDVRLIDFNTKVGLIKKADIESHYAQLKDVKANSEAVNLIEEEDSLGAVEKQSETSQFM